MERKRTIEELKNSLHPAKLAQRAYPEATKENVFTRFKPASDTKIVTKDGHEITSEAVLIIIKELKQCIEKNEVNRFSNLIIENCKKDNLTTSEYRSLFKAVITDKGTTVSDLLSDLDDIENP